MGHRGAGRGQRCEPRPPVLWVRARIIVEKEDRGAGDECGGQVETAAHPARVGANEAVGGICQHEVVEELRGTLP